MSRPVDRAPRHPARSGAARRRRARELRPPGARLAARARPRLVGLLALVPPGRGRRPAVLRAAGLPHARGAARHGNPDVARRRGAHGGRLRGSLRALAPRLGVGGGADLSLGRARHGRRPPPRRAVRRAVPRGVERPGLRVRARVVGGSGRARLAHRLDHVALGGGRRRRAPHPDPARRADRAARLRARPAPRAAPLDACASRRRDVPRGRGAAPRRLGGAQRSALRRPRRGAREQGVGSLLPRRRRRRPGERRCVAPARGRHRAGGPDAAALREPRRRRRDVLQGRRQPRGDPDDRALRPRVRLGLGLRHPLRRVARGDPGRSVALRRGSRRDVLGLPHPALRTRAA